MKAGITDLGNRKSSSISIELTKPGVWIKFVIIRGKGENVEKRQMTKALRNQSVPLKTKQVFIMKAFKIDKIGGI